MNGEISDAQIAAMQAIFDLTEAVGLDTLTIGDLEQVVRLAVKDGHGQILIVLKMASHAVSQAWEVSDSPPATDTR